MSNIFLHHSQTWKSYFLSIKWKKLRNNFNREAEEDKIFGLSPPTSNLAYFWMKNKQRIHLEELHFSKWLFEREYHYCFKEDFSYEGNWSDWSDEVLPFIYKEVRTKHYYQVILDSLPIKFDLILCIFWAETWELRTIYDEYINLLMVRYDYIQNSNCIIIWAV